MKNNQRQKLIRNRFSRSTSSLIQANKPKIDINSNSKRKQKSKRSTVINKQNIETQNKIFVPQTSFKPKNIKSSIRKHSAFGLSTTVNIVVNQSHVLKKQQLLDSLLYGQVDLTYSQDYRKQQQNEQLLIESQPNISYKQCKILTPIKSISQYSLTDNNNHLFIAQKVINKNYNCILKLRQNSQKDIQNSFVIEEKCVNLLKRLFVIFESKQETIFNFYNTICTSSSKQDMCIRIRTFMFQNSVIFNKRQLQQFAVLIQNKMMSRTKTKRQQQINFCQQDLWSVFQNLFFEKKTEEKQIPLSLDLFVSQETLQKIFDQGDIVSVWKFLKELTSQHCKQISASFRQSRFCIQQKMNQFVSESEQKRKQQTKSRILNWINKFLISKNKRLNPQSEHSSFIFA